MVPVPSLWLDSSGSYWQSSVRALRQPDMTLQVSLMKKLHREHQGGPKTTWSCKYQTDLAEMDWERRTSMLVHGVLNTSLNFYVTWWPDLWWPGVKHFTQCVLLSCRKVPKIWRRAAPPFLSYGRKHEGSIICPPFQGAGLNICKSYADRQVRRTVVFMKFSCPTNWPVLHYWGPTPIKRVLIFKPALCWGRGTQSARGVVLQKWLVGPKSKCSTTTT